MYCCIIQRLVTSDGSDGTQNDPGHPENEWEWLSRRLGVLRGSNSIHDLISDIYRRRRPSGLGADGSGRERSVPARGFTSAGADKVRTLWNFTRSHHGGRGKSIFQLAVPLNPRLLLDCQAFPLLFVRAAGDEGDTVLLGHPAILTELVIGRNGSPGVAPPNVLLPAFYELPLQPSS